MGDTAVSEQKVVETSTINSSENKEDSKTESKSTSTKKSKTRTQSRGKARAKLIRENEEKEVREIKENIYIVFVECETPGNIGFLARTMASLFFLNRLNNKPLEQRSRKFVLYNGVPFVVFFLIFLIWTLVTDGYAVTLETGEVYLEKMKYLNNFIEMPVVGILFVLGVVTVLYGIVNTIINSKFKKGIWFTGVGTVVTVTMLLLVSGLNNTAYYPSSVDLQSSLTINNSSSSYFTLSVMSVVSLFVPVVIGYIIFAWRSLEKKKLGLKEVNTDGHIY